MDTQHKKKHEYHKGGTSILRIENTTKNDATGHTSTILSKYQFRKKMLNSFLVVSPRVLNQ